MASPDRPASLHLSIHDVTPGTLERVAGLVRRLERHGLPKATLLVIPGAGWDAPALARLGELAAAGHPLAGHGWTHRAARIGGPYHRLHSALVSGPVAEHLGLDAHGIAALIRGCHAWFRAHDLPVPELYVPPAWAMGRIPRSWLAKLPFRRYEYARGIYDARLGRFTPLPVIGFEAEGNLRAGILRAWNRVNRWAAPRLGGLRIAIHPHDEALALRGDLERALAHGPGWVGGTKRAHPVGDRAAA